MYQYSSQSGAVVRIPDYDSKKPVLDPDPSRIFTSREGDRFLVLCCGFNWDADAATFATYNEICVIDCMHGMTNSTDGLNCVGVDANLHNISALRVFIFAQTQEVFRWVLCEAFPALVKNYQNIRVFFTDDDQHLGPVLKMLVGPGKLFPLATYLKCTWHLIRHNIEDVFGKGCEENPWQQKLIAILSRVRKCETLEEFDPCVSWMWRLVKGMPLGAVRSKLRLQVAAFITKRLEMKDSWVMYHQLLLPTRGCSTTQRVESDHGTNRDAGVDARNSWLLTCRRMHAILDKRRTLKREWCDRQLGSSLLRGPAIASTNSAPVLSASSLKALDAAYLPWAIETLEEQNLLSSLCEVKYVGSGAPALGASSCKFIVWTTNPNYGAGSDSEEDDADERESVDSDHDPNIDDDIVTAPVPMSPGSKFRKENDDSAATYPELDYEALPAGTRFHYLRLRIVSVSMVGDLVKFECSCGFVCRIGTACRHILSVIRFMANAIHQAYQASIGGGCAAPDMSDEDILNKMDMTGFFRLDWCSKIKYHSVIFGSPLAPLDSAIPHCFLQDSTFLQDFVSSADTQQLKTPTLRIENGKKIYADVPKEGLPANGQYESRNNDDSTGHSDADDEDGPDVAGRPHRFTPTDANAELILRKILKSVGKNAAARAYVGAQLLAIQIEVARIVQPKAKPSDLRRHFTGSDFQHGRPQPQSRPNSK